MNVKQLSNQFVRLVSALVREGHRRRTQAVDCWSWGRGCRCCPALTALSQYPPVVYGSSPHRNKLTYQHWQLFPMSGCSQSGSPVVWLCRCRESAVWDIRGLRCSSKSKDVRCRIQETGRWWWQAVEGCQKKAQYDVDTEVYLAKPPGKTTLKCKIKPASGRAQHKFCSKLQKRPRKDRRKDQWYKKSTDVFQILEGSSHS